MDLKQDNRKSIPDLGNRKIPSVTQVTGILAKKKLISWAAKITAQYFKDEILDLIKHGFMTYEEFIAIDSDSFYEKALIHHTETAMKEADKGTKTHQAIKRFLKAEPEEEIDFERLIEKPFRAFQEWWEKNEVIPIMIEERVYCPDNGGYKGQPDLLAYVKEGLEDSILYLIDFKTSNAIYEDMILQLCGYYFAIKHSLNLEPHKAQIIRLDKNEGFPEFHTFEREEIYEGYGRFLCLLDYWHKTHGVKEIREEDWM